MKNLICILVCWLTMTALPSCSRKVSEAVSVVRNSDSTVVANTDNVVRETLRIDTVYVPGETTVLEILVPEGCDSLLTELNALKDSDRSRVSVKKVPGRNAIRIEADCKEFEAVITGKDIEIQRLKEVVSSASNSSDVKESETIVVYRAGFIHKAAMWWSGISISAILIYVAWQLAKTWLKTQFPFLRFIP